MANLKIIFDASISKAKAAIDALVAKDAEAKRKMAQPAPEKPDRRGALEEVRTAKVAAEAAKREKAETQAAIKAQAAAVRKAEAAIKAAEGEEKATQKATKELEKQRKELERLRELGSLQGRKADMATVNEHRARQTVQKIPKVDVNPAPAVSGFQRFLIAGRVAAAGIESRFQSMRSRLASTFSGIRGVMVGALAFAGVTVGIGATRQMVDELDQLGKSARNLSMSTEELQRFQFAAKDLGFPMEQLEPALNKIRKLVGDAADGAPEAKKKLDSLGVSLSDLTGKSSAQQFDEIASAIKGIKDPTEQAAAAIEIFGDNQGGKMLNFIREYQSEAAKLGDNAIISSEEIQAAERFNSLCVEITANLKAWAVNSGFISQLAEAAELVAFIAAKKGERTEADAAKKRIYTRATGTDYAIQKAKESGKYTPDEIAQMENGAKEYKNAHSTSISSRGSFGLIDQALKDAGLGGLARSGNNPFTDNWKDSNPSMSLKNTPEEIEAERKKREEQKQKEAERAKRRQEAKEATDRDFNDKINSQVRGLENRASGKSDDTEERRAAAIDTEIAKAEGIAKTAGKTLTPEQRQRVTDAAKAVFDAEESKTQGKAHDAIGEDIAALEEKYKMQQMINEGKAREAAIQQEINRAEKSARTAGVELTDDERSRIASAAGKNFDQAVANETSPTMGPQNRIFTDSLLKMGGVIGNIGGASEVNYGKQQLDKLTESSARLSNIEQKVTSLYDKLPGRLEAAAGFDPEF